MRRVEVFQQKPRASQLLESNQQKGGSVITVITKQALMEIMDKSPT